MGRDTATQRKRHVPNQLRGRDEGITRPVTGNLKIRRLENPPRVDCGGKAERVCHFPDGMRGSCCHMKAVINIGDPVAKVVGRRMSSAPLVVQTSETESNRQWRESGFGPRIRKGVYRYHTYEEADAWLMDHLTRKPGN